MTTMVIALDLANAEHAQALAQFITLATQVGAQFQVGVGAPAPAPAPVQDAPEPEPEPVREYKPTHDVVLALVADKAYVHCTTLDGKFVGESGVRKAVNARIRKAGGVWDQTHKAYKFPSAKAASNYVAGETDAAIKARTPEGAEPDASAFPDGYFALVTAEQWQAQRDAAAARKARKG